MGSSATEYYGTVSNTGVISSPVSLAQYALPGSKWWEIDNTVHQSNGDFITAVYTTTWDGHSSAGNNNGGDASEIWRTNPAATAIDTTFGTSGFYSLTGTTGLFTNSISLTSDGKLLIAGFADVNGVADSIMLAHYNLTTGTGSVTGTVYNDLNLDKKVETGEGLANVPVYVDLKGTGKYAAGDPIADTDVYGNYSLSGLVPGTYTVRVDLSLLPTLGVISPAGGSYSVKVTAGGTTSADNFELSGPAAAVYFGTVAIPAGESSPSATAGTDFGSVTPNSTGPIHVFTLKNLGGVALTTSALTVPLGFSIVTALPATLAPGASVTFSIKLLTTKTGTFSGNVSFNSNNVSTTAANPYQFAIRGVVATVFTGPTVGITAPDPDATGPIDGAAGSGLFLVTTTANSAPLTLTFKLTGTAEYTSSAKDFNLTVAGATSSFNFATNILTITLAEKATKAAILVTPLSDIFSTASETVILSVVSDPVIAINPKAASATITIAKI